MSIVGDLQAELAATEDRDDLVRFLTYVRDLRADLAVIAKDAERELLARSGERRWVVAGLGEVAVHKAKKRNEWDHDGLRRRVIALALDERILDEETGVYESTHEAVARVLAECARPEWRLTPLRARGLDISEFCHEADQGWSVELPPRRDG